MTLSSNGLSPRGACASATAPSGPGFIPSRTGTSAGRQWVRPAKARKSREVAIRRAECCAVFDGDRRQRCIHHQCPGGLTVLRQAAQDLPMALSGFKHAGCRLSEPRRHVPFGFCHRQRTLEHPRVRRNPEKRPQREPRKPHERRSRQPVFEPRPAGGVPVGPRIVGVQQDVRVDQHHRCSGPSICSMRSAMLSRLTRGRRGAGQTASQRVVDHLAEGQARPPRQRLQPGRHVLIERKRRAHVMMLKREHHDVNG